MRHVPANITRVFVLLLKVAVLFLCLWFIYDRLQNHFRLISDIDFTFSYPVGSVILFIVFLLFFAVINWMTEAVKWRMMLQKTSGITLAESFKVVLYGLSLGFITPGRVGEVAGRVWKTESENRKQTAAIFVYSSLLQTFVTLLFGTLSLFFFHLLPGKPVVENPLAEFLLFSFCLLSTFVVFYLVMSGFFSGRLVKNRFIYDEKISQSLSFARGEKINFLLLSVVRYLVFCFQFTALLFVSGISSDFLFLFENVTLVYLFSLFIPSLVTGKPGIREAAALFLLGGDPATDVKIIIVSLVIWTVNLALPALAGAVLFNRSGKTNE